MPNYSPKLPSSAIQHAPERFWSATPEFWQALQAHVTEPTPEQRKELATIVEAYVRKVVIEQNAPAVSEADTRIAELKTAAIHFRYVLDTPAAEVSSEAMHFVEGLLNDRFEVLRGSSGPPRVAQISALLLDFLEACDYAERIIIKEKRKRRGFIRGDAWRNYFVPALEKFWMDSLGREKPKIRRDSNIYEPASEIPFVAFTRAVERALPANYWKPSQGIPTPATYRAAVSDALRGRQPRARGRKRAGSDTG